MYMWFNTVLVIIVVNSSEKMSLDHLSDLSAGKERFRYFIKPFIF